MRTVLTKFHSRTRECDTIIYLAFLTLIDFFQLKLLRHFGSCVLAVSYILKGFSKWIFHIEKPPILLCLSSQIDQLAGTGGS